MNVEICSTVKLVKYLYKYVYKGQDRVSFHIYSVNNPDNIDEINDYQAGRWVAAAKVFWRIYRFNLNEMTPAVYTLQLHLPEFFVWKPAKKRWTERKRKRVIGGVVTVAPNERERYYLRLLLSHVRAPTCFEDLLTVNGKLMLSYREAAFQMGQLQSDTHLEDTLNEAATFQMSSSLRTLFAIFHDEHLTREIRSELSIKFTEQDLLLLSKLNIGQRYAYDVILQEVFSSRNTSFFVDGPGGTGKTFLYRSILATLRSQGFIAIVVASSGVAASILPRGRTAHSSLNSHWTFLQVKSAISANRALLLSLL
nr:uncharacterized protein LOC113710019 [Coffea arabica]